MKKGFEPDCDPDQVLAATDIGLQAQLMTRTAGPTEKRASRRLDIPASLSTYERRDLARLAHAGVFHDGFVRSLYFSKDEFRTVRELDHPDLRNEGLSCLDAGDFMDVMRDRLDHLSGVTNLKTYDLRQFHARMGIHPFGAEHMLHDNDGVAHIRKTLYEAYPCELYTRGAVFGDFAVDFERPTQHYTKNVR